MIVEISKKLNKLINSLFYEDKSQESKILNKALLVVLYFFGVILWVRFLNYGDIPNNRLDWGDITFPRLQVIQQAVQQGEFPLYVAEVEGLKGVTNLFLSIPDQILSPDVFLLRFLSVENFIVVHTLIFYSLGFWGLILFKNKHNISFIAFVPLFLLFNFNGHIVSHLSVGHLTWASYFLFSFFFLFLFEIFDEKNLSWNWIGKITLLQFFIFLSGGYHQFVWVLFFLGILFVINKKNRKFIFGGMCFSILINSFRIFPAALLSKDLDISFLAGFRTFEDVLRGLVMGSNPLDSYYPLLQKVDVMVWEQNYFLGLLGFVFMILFGIILLRGNKNFELIIIPSIIIIFFSIGNFYKILFDTGLPLLSGERISTRFLIMAILYLLFIGTIQFHTNLKHINNSFKKTGLLIGILILANDLSQHLAHWELKVISEIFPAENFQNTLSLGSGNNELYAGLLIAGGIISLSSAIFLIFKYFSDIRQMKIVKT